MIENTYREIYHYIQQSSNPVSPHELSRITHKSRVSVHTALKKLLSAGDIEKHGVSPKVTYSKKGYISRTPANLLTIEDIKEKIGPVLKKYPIIYAGVVGSVARGEATANSDIDIMISYHRPFSIIMLVGLERALTETLGVKVDLLTDRGANKYVISSMMNDFKLVYGSR